MDKLLADSIRIAKCKLDFFNKSSLMSYTHKLEIMISSIIICLFLLIQNHERTKFEQRRGKVEKTAPIVAYAYA